MSGNDITTQRQESPHGDVFFLDAKCTKKSDTISNVRYAKSLLMNIG
jgi:hypothetical protein